MTQDKGRISREKGNPAILDAWRNAPKLAPHVPGGDWVPWGSIKIRDEILPREAMDYRAIETYKELLAVLPPIEVQRDTFVLIDGRHRLEAFSSVYDHVPIVETDVSDEELWERAFEGNTAHGVPLKMTERVKAAKAYLTAHPRLSDQVIGDWAGVSRQRVWEWRSHAKALAEGREERAAERDQVVRSGQPGSGAEVVTNGQSDTRVGRDGKTYPVRQSSVDRLMNTVPGTLAPPNLPKPSGLNGVPAYRAPAVPVAPPVRQLVIDFGSILEYSPREAAEGIGVDLVRLKLAEANRARKWLDDYVMALTEQLDAAVTVGETEDF